MNKSFVSEQKKKNKKDAAAYHQKHGVLKSTIANLST